MWPRQFPAFVVDSLQGFLVAGEKIRLVVPLVDSLHELVGKPLCFALARHSALRPGLRSSLSRGSGVIPVKELPLGPKILQLGPLITFLHHGPPSVVLQSRSLCSIKGRHWTTSEPERKL